jgi:phage shock protein PspC (stress-responsive transcriptional regulator)
MSMNDRLYRSRGDRMIAGVAGGLAQSMRLDPSLVRVVWAILVFATGGIALVIYIVMAIVVPEEQPGTVHVARPPMTGGSFALPVGAGLVVLGAYLLLRQYVPALDFNRIWPVFLIATGVLLLLVAMRGRSDGSGEDR